MKSKTKKQLKMKWASSEKRVGHILLRRSLAEAEKRKKSHI